VLGFPAGVGQHRAGQYVFGLRMGRNAKPGHIDADDADPVDLLRQKAQWDARRRRHAEIDHHDGVILRGIGELEYSFADILEQLAGD
jgi:hypothetical protein